MKRYILAKHEEDEERRRREGGGGAGGAGGGDGDDEAAPLPPPGIPLPPPGIPLPPLGLPFQSPADENAESGEEGGGAEPPSGPGIPQSPPPRVADREAEGRMGDGEEESDEVEHDKLASRTWRRLFCRPVVYLFSETVLIVFVGAREHSKHIIKEKIEILSQQYAHFRRTPEDSSCFYRAFLFTYLENLGQLQDRQPEVARLMEHLATSEEGFHYLGWDSSYLPTPGVYFSSVMAEFVALVNSVADSGQSSDELVDRCLQATRSTRIIAFLRLLAEIDIRTGGAEYQSVYPAKFTNALSYCRNQLRPMEAETQLLAIRALTYALGIPLRVETVDGGLEAGTAQIRRMDFFPRSEPDKSSHHASPSLWSNATPPTPGEMGTLGMLSLDRTPLLTLMRLRYPRRWYILYR